MDAFHITGGRPLRGTVAINGSKNACLPLMVAALLTDQPVTLHGVPDLADIRNMQRLLDSLGCTLGKPDVPDASAAPRKKPASASACASQPTPTLSESASEASGTPSSKSLTIHGHDTSKVLAHYDIVRTMRAGICVLGPLLAARGEARVSMPGGCAIGDRPVDLHLRGLRALGADIELEAGYIVARAPAPGSKSKRPNGLRGAHIFLGGPNGSTVLGTANVMSAAVLAQGTTVIECAACEPEIEDLGRLLIGMGANITGLGSPRITIHGVDALHGTSTQGHHVIPDRIEAGTYLMAAAITHGDVTLTNFPTDTLGATLDRLAEVGISVEREQGTGNREQSKQSIGKSSSPTPNSQLPTPNYDTVRIAASRRLNAVQVTTQPHPGFPTDLQAQIMALLTLADGNSIITEKIFPDRFLHCAELMRMGADITRVGASAMVTGVRELVGAPVMASDLRASAGLVIAGLAARGDTTINRVYHLDRGYERMEATLQQLGAQIERIPGGSV